MSAPKKGTKRGEAPRAAAPAAPAAPAVSRYRPHPWHGLEVGPEPPAVLHAFIEITPFDLMKYEVDKVSGYLRVDRPQRGPSHPPALYGFVPRTYCAERVRVLAPAAARGDGDPPDLCVLSERAIARSEILVRARVIGGLQMIDGGEADDTGNLYWTSQRYLKRLTLHLRLGDAATASLLPALLNVRGHTIRI